MKKMTLRTHPLGMVLMILFDLVFFTVPILTYKQLLQLFKQGDILYVLGDLAAVYLVLYLTVSLVKNRIVFTGESLSIQILENNRFYKIDSFQIDPKGISKILVGNELFLKPRLAEKGKVLNRLARYYDGSGSMFAKKRAERIVVLVILAGDGRFFTVGIRPFSKAELRKLLAELESMGVGVEIQRGIFKSEAKENE